MHYQLPRPAIKAYELVRFLHAGGGIPCRPHPTICLVCFSADGAGLRAVLLFVEDERQLQADGATSSVET